MNVDAVLGAHAVLLGAHAVLLAVSVHGLVTSYGYGAVFALVAIESLGVPLPGETTLVAAATYAGATHRLSVWLIFAIAAAAAIIGDSIGYWIGDKGGYRLLYRYGHYVHVEESDIKVVRYLFERHGGAVVFFGRFVVVLRSYAAFLAGTSKLGFRRFFAFNASGGILWAALYAFVAYYAASFVSRTSTPVEIALGVAAVVLVAAMVLLVRRHMSDLTDRAEAAFPGPLERPGAHHPHRDAGAPHRSSPTRAGDEPSSHRVTSARVGAGDDGAEAHEGLAGPEPGAGEGPAETG